MHQPRKWNAKAYKLDTAPLPSKRRSVKGQARQAACRVKKNGFQANARTFRFVLPRPLHRPPFGRGSGFALPPSARGNLEKISRSDRGGFAQWGKDNAMSQLGFSLKVVKGYHLTATNRRAISTMIKNRWKHGHSRDISYQLTKVNDEVYDCEISKNERDDWGRLVTRRSHVTVQVQYAKTKESQS